MMRWGILLKVFSFVLVLLAVKVAIEFFGLDLIAISPLVTAFVGGVIFLIAIILAGTLSDYKEGEKIPSELSTSILTLYKEFKIATNNEENIVRAQAHTKQLLEAIIANFKNNIWKQTDVNNVIDKLDEDVLSFSRTGVAPQYIARLRNELTNIDRISNRIETIKETTFIPAAYSVAQLAVGAAILTLLFMKIDPFLDGIIMIGVISLILISLLLLIRDMDDPFEVGKKTYADVDLGLVYKLKDRLNNL